MICNKKTIQKCGWYLSTGRGKFLAGGSEIFVLDEWVVTTDLLVNRLTRWPTPYKWRMGNNSRPSVHGSILKSRSTYSSISKRLFHPFM